MKTITGKATRGHMQHVILVTILYLFRAIIMLINANHLISICISICGLIFFLMVWAVFTMGFDLSIREVELSTRGDFRTKLKLDHAFGLD